MEAVEFDWLRWQDSPPHACCIPVEVACDGWDHIRLWRPATPLPDDALGLVWRPCSKEILCLALEGGICSATALMTGHPGCRATAVWITPAGREPGRSVWMLAGAVRDPSCAMATLRPGISALACSVVWRSGRGAGCCARRSGGGVGRWRAYHHAWVRCRAVARVRRAGGGDVGGRAFVTSARSAHIARVHARENLRSGRG